MSPPSVAMLMVVAGLFAAGVQLVVQRSLMRMVLGFVLLGHAANLALLIAGGPPGAKPVEPATATEPVADPLPQAMALTAIVISFGVTALLLGLVFRAVQLTGDDEVPEGEDVEDQPTENQVSEDGATDDEPEPER